MTSKNGNTFINFGDGDRLILEDVLQGQLHANDFIL